MKAKEWEIDPVSLFSHELKTPLSSLRMGLDALQSQPKGEERQRILRLMREEVERMIGLVCGHLDQRLLEPAPRESSVVFSRAFSSKTPQEEPQKAGAQEKKREKRGLLRFSWTPWEDIARKALEAALLAARQKSVSFKAGGLPFEEGGKGRRTGAGRAVSRPAPAEEAFQRQRTAAPAGGQSIGGNFKRGAGGAEDSEEFVEVFADTVWLAQALGNLLSNAIKASPKGGLVCIEWSFAPEEGLLCSVADEGAGFLPGDKDKTFKKGPQAAGGGHGPESSPDSRGLKSHGLGIRIARNIVEAHGGKLAAGPFREGGPAARRDGQGAVFYFALPLARRRSRPLRRSKKTG